MASPVGAALSGAPARNVDRLFEFCVLGMVACGYFAVAGSGYLDFPTVILTAAALFIRSFMASGLIRVRPPALLVNLATLCYIAFYPIDYLFVSREFLPSTVHLVFYLAITKVLTAVTDRDFSYLKVVAFLELMAASMLNGRANFFVFLSLFLLFAVGTFSTSEIRRSASRDVRVVRAGFRGLQPRLMALGLFLSIGVLSMTAGLFFFLPRTARAAFRHLVSERYHLPGFSNEITLGQIGEIKSQSTTVMHVRFLSATWPANLKWRGMALSQFDGKRWSNDSMYEPVKVERGGLVRLLEERKRPLSTTRRIAYEVHQKDFGADTLFFAGVPEFLSIGVPVIRRSSTSGIRMPLGIAGGVNYVAHAYIPSEGLPDVTPDPLTPRERADYLELPSLDPRIPRLARDFTALSGTSEARARAIESHLRSEYGYTLSLLNRPVADPLSDFLFERKKGHCEYFASAMAVMLRTIDIPSRVVTGFQSGVYNSISGLQLIRTSDAHSWVERICPGGAGRRSIPRRRTERSGRFAVDALQSLRGCGGDVLAGLGTQLRSRSSTAARYAHAGLFGTGRDLDGQRFAAGPRRVFQAQGLFEAAWRSAGCGVPEFRVAAVLWAGAAEGDEDAPADPASAARAGSRVGRDAAVTRVCCECWSDAGSSIPAWLTPSEFARTIPA